MRDTYSEGDPVTAGVPLVRLQGVVKTYRTNAGDVQALRGIDADFCAGELAVVVGRSGAGKSTLTNMITGVDDLSGGRVVVDGVDVHSLGENQLALWRGLNVGIVYQSFELLPQLSILDNVMMPMDLCGLYHRRKSPERAMNLLRMVGLEDHVRKPPGAVSGGQRQRVAIARALANDPSLIVADEPTGNLDSVTAEDILRLFEGLVADGKTIIMVTHDVTIGERANHMLQIEDGMLIDERRS